MHMMQRSAKVLEIQFDNGKMQQGLARITAAPCDQEGLETRFAVGEKIRFQSFPALIGTVAVGDSVRLEVSALAKSLGTGGYASTLCLEGSLPPDSLPGVGHMVKARYTPSQVLVLGVDEQNSPYHARFQNDPTLGGMPVVVADLHSAVPAIIAGLRQARPGTKVAYLYTDGAALPVALSRQTHSLRRAGWIESVISCGQAFGGDLEAVNVASGLVAARAVAGAEVAIIAQGPGNLGTGTKWGFSGLDCASDLALAAILGGQPIAALRVSSADKRPRHYGISHHTTTMLREATLVSVQVPLPRFAPVGELEASLGGEQGEFQALLREQAQSLATCPALPHSAAAVSHRVVEVSTRGLSEALAACPVRLSTMGRSLSEDPGSFLAAAVAGVWAAQQI